MSGPISEPWDAVVQPASYGPDAKIQVAQLAWPEGMDLHSIVWDPSVRPTWWRRLLWRSGYNLDSAPRYRISQQDAPGSPDLPPDDS